MHRRCMSGSTGTLRRDAPVHVGECGGAGGFGRWCALGIPTATLAGRGPAISVGIHARKTGALFAAATEIGAVIAGRIDQRAAMHAFGMNLGLAFQGYDDLLDARAASGVVGKDTGRDGDKATLVKLIGFDAALAQADALMEAALAQVPDLATGNGMLAAYVAGLTAVMRGPLGLPAKSQSHA